MPDLARVRKHESHPGIVASLKEHRSTLVVSPTGTGKSFLFTVLASKAKGRVLVLAERRQLVRQTRDYIERETGLPCVMEMGEEVASNWGSYLERPKVVVGCVPSVRRRLTKYRKDEFSLIIVDEAKHAPNDSYDDILEYFSGAKVVGFEATPDRADGVSLMTRFESQAFEYLLPEAIEDGWLVPFEQRVMQVDVDLSGLKVNRKTGDFNQAAVAQQVNTNKALYKIAGETLKYQGTRPTIVFAQDVAQAEELSNIINDARHGSAVWIAYTMEESLRDRNVRAFKKGEVQTLVNVNIVSEGFDHPATSCIVIGAPTASRARFAQRLGRGGRPAARTDGTWGTVVDGIDTAEARLAAIAASEKPTCLVLDFTDCSDSHRLVHPSDVLSPVELTERERRIVRQMTRSDAAADVKQVIAKAKALAAEEEEELKRRRLQVVVPTVGTYRAPHQGGGMRERQLHGPMTQKQMARLRQQGYPIDSMSTSELHKAWGDFVYRIKSNKPSKAQERALQRFRVPVPATRKEATELLDRCMSRGVARAV